MIFIAWLLIMAFMAALLYGMFCICIKLPWRLVKASRAYRRQQDAIRRGAT